MPSIFCLISDYVSTRIVRVKEHIQGQSKAHFSSLNSLPGNSLIPPGNRPIKRQKQFPPCMGPFMSLSTWLLEKVESLSVKQMERSASRWTPSASLHLYHMESGGRDVSREYGVRGKELPILRTSLFLHEPPAIKVQCESVNVSSITSWLKIRRNQFHLWLLVMKS